MLVRLYSGSDGQSHFEELSTDKGSAVFAESKKATELEFRSSQPGYLAEWHNAPRGQYIITLSGSAEIVIGDGTVKVLGPGDVLLADDLTGKGHITRPSDDWTRAMIPIE